MGCEQLQDNKQNENTQESKRKILETSRPFLDKEYALISRRYQLHPASTTMQCSSGHTDAHSQKRRRRRITKKKSPALANNSL
jgi:hypothetical protein